MPESTTPIPPALGCHVDTELPARVAVHDTGLSHRAVVVVFGDDLHSVRLVGPGSEIHQLIIEADRQLTRLANSGQ
jgi:hypothetical protein